MSLFRFSYVKKLEAKLNVKHYTMLDPLFILPVRLNMTPAQLWLVGEAENTFKRSICSYCSKFLNMKRILIFVAVLLPLFAQAQFKGTEKGGLTIVVTDGTYDSKHSPQRPPGNGKYVDPIRPLGMVDAIQAGAFVERPKYGKIGFILIFCVNDSVGGKQGEYTVNGQTYKGIFRLIRQQISLNEEIPKGMTTYRLAGTVFFLGIS